MIGLLHRVTHKDIHSSRHGQIGTVVCITKDERDGSNNILVEFDNNVGGHAGSTSGRLFKDGHCWWYKEEDLIIVEE